MNKTQSKIKDFSNYLLELGFLNGANYSEFINKFNEINRSSNESSGSANSDKDIDSIYYKDNILKTIVEFYNEMNEDKKNYLHSIFLWNIVKKRRRKR